MLEIARQLERAAVWFSPVILIGPGLAVVLLGLFVWLGGLGFRKTLMAIVGAVSGGICGFFISGRNIVSVTVTAGLSAVLAIMLERVFITILAGILAAILGFAVLAGPHIGIEDSLKGHPVYETENITMSLDIQQSVEVAKRYISEIVTEIERIFSRMSVYNRVIIAVLAVFFIVVGFSRQRLILAICCAALGAMLIFAGMILLLLYKGAAPISRICQNQSYYLSVFAAMTAFGTAEQLLFCRRIKEILTGKKGKGKDGKEAEKTSVSWRNR
jgi:hypothetical protein